MQKINISRTKDLQGHSKYGTKRFYGSLSNIFVLLEYPVAKKMTAKGIGAENWGGYKAIARETLKS